MINNRKWKKITERVWKDIREYGWVMPVFLVYYLILHSVYDAFCPFLIATGIPCAGCGLTRAGLYLLQGQWARAAAMNPSIYPVALSLLYCAYFRYIRGSRIKGIRKLLPLLVISMLGIYGVRMYLYFPDRIPYVYQSKNFSARWIPGYSQWARQLLRQIHSWRSG